MAEFEKLLCTDSKVETLKKINANIDYTANTDLSNLSATGEKHFLGKSQITNCITEIPQRIKCTYENNTFTLKAGSEVIVPDGTGNFQYVTVPNDLSTSKYSTGNTDCMVFYNTATNTFSYYIPTLNAFSGNSAPTVTDTINIWYDTTNNVIKQSSDKGATWSSSDKTSFPIALLSRSNGSFTALKQVYNGIGYIGSTLFVDKGVKGLIPNGRNEDGTLNNIEFVIDKLRILTDTNTADGYNILISETGFTNSIIRAYDTERNIVYNTNTNEQEYYCMVGTLDRKSGVISNFKPKLPFRAVDYSDKSDIAFGMIPSSQYTSLTLGATGSTYTAPANGWFVLQKRQGASTYNYNSIKVQDGTLEYKTNVGGNEWALASLVVPVKKGQTVKIDYTTTGLTEAFKFVYAESEVE